jgi:midasin
MFHYFLTFFIKQDENGQGDSNKFDDMPEKETEPEKEEKIGELDDGQQPEKEEEKLIEPEVTSQIDKKKLTQETPRDEDGEDKGKMEQLFAHTKDVEKCTDKTVDRANEDEVDNNMDVDEEDEKEEDGKKDKTENATNSVRKFENVELIETENVGRSDETVFSKNENFQMAARSGETSSIDILTDFRMEVTSAELKEWLELCASVHDLSQTLTEQLRLILEPTKATKFRGDFKSGKKLNMRKIIPFIASNYRKDKIWLRRTKPSKRDYFVMVAVDDSSSMNVNEVKRTAYMSLATLCGALSTLEVGKFGIMSFGNEAKLVHPLQPNFAHEDGAHLLKTLTFEQVK